MDYRFIAPPYTQFLKVWNTTKVTCLWQKTIKISKHGKLNQNRNNWIKIVPASSICPGDLPFVPASSICPDFDSKLSKHEIAKHENINNESNNQKLLIWIKTLNLNQNVKKKKKN